MDWIPAIVPGTAAAALASAGRWSPGDAHDFDAQDWWFRTRFEVEPAAAGEELVLRLEGIATCFEVFLNGVVLTAGESMFEAQALDVGELLGPGENELAIRCRALAPLLHRRRKPRARWRTRVADNGLRHLRTMLLGRAPGFAPGPAAVGPWRPVALERRSRFALEAVELRPRLDGEAGVLELSARLRGLGEGAPPSAADLVISDETEGSLRVSVAEDGAVEITGEVRIEAVERWWPHTHGEPALHEVTLRLAGADGEVGVALGHVGFRELAPAPPGTSVDPIEDGLDLHLNGVRTFARGAVWTPIDPVGMAPTAAELRAALEQVRAAGMNMVRLPGLGAYESTAFHDLCDELGILVWQDFMFANFDYPIADQGFRAKVEAEARALTAELRGRPSLAVLCGNSEVEQQVAMLGLEPESGRGELFGELLPKICAASCPEVPYLPSAPCGGELPFRPSRGVANYYGVGGYRRPLADARLAEVRFAAECLAFANVPDEAGVEAILPGAPLDLVVHHPRWKAGVPRDVGSGWDFDDVRDHYLRLLFGVDPGELRRHDHEHYLELSRAVSGEAMAAVFGEWRRQGSPCGGGLVLWLRDLAPGAGWGILDSTGRPKAAYHYLRRALLPTAVWIVDEGLGGADVHVANDGPDRLRARLRIGLYRDHEQSVGEVSRELSLDPHGCVRFGVEDLLDRFVDASWAYRFGPPAQDLIVATLEPLNGGEPLSQAFYLPAGRHVDQLSPERLGIEARLEAADSPSPALVLRARRFVCGLRIEASSCEAADSWLMLEPGVERRVRLSPRQEEKRAGAIAIRALNMSGRISAQWTQTD